MKKTLLLVIVWVVLFAIAAACIWFVVMITGCSTHTSPKKYGAPHDPWKPFADVGYYKTNIVCDEVTNLVVRWKKPNQTNTVERLHKQIGN